ncbi:hypothetical protein [Endozoicomonas ascidiicola]|uniref:hypothetical protein n=1 Tax=Endozoicomonas ascidiicola TaxID=1698521 RepID=UPI00082A64A3|nr:hypothetical protein [Endozoicomonas ascidiicola]
MIGLLDTDILYKLTSCNLLDESICYLGLSDPQILDAAPHVIKKKTFGRKKSYGYDLPEVQDRFSAACKRASRMTESPNDMEMFMRFGNVPGIDPGEAVLICHAIETGSALLISGDKNFYNALLGSPELMSYCSGLEGRLVCFEHLILCLIESYQYSYISDRVAPARQCDKTLTLAFSQGKKTSEAIVTEALVSFSKEVVLGLGDLAYHHRPWYK